MVGKLSANSDGSMNFVHKQHLKAMVMASFRTNSYNLKLLL